MNIQITAKQFLNEAIHVQRTLINWWEPAVYDLVQVNNKEQSMYEYGITKDKSKVVPLFTEWQIQEFIIDNTTTNMELRGFVDSNSYYNIVLRDNGFTYEAKGKETVDAWWELACIIAKQMEVYYEVQI